MKHYESLFLANDSKLNLSSTDIRDKRHKIVIKISCFAILR